MCGVSVDIPQRTDEVFEQNSAALSRKKKGGEFSCNNKGADVV